MLPLCACPLLRFEVIAGGFSRLGRESVVLDGRATHIQQALDDAAVGISSVHGRRRSPRGIQICSADRAPPRAAVRASLRAARRSWQRWGKQENRAKVLSPFPETASLCVRWRCVLACVLAGKDAPCPLAAPSHLPSREELFFPEKGNGH